MPHMPAVRSPLAALDPNKASKRLRTLQMHTVVYDGDSFNTQSPVSCQAPVAASAQQDEVLELPAWIPKAYERAAQAESGGFASSKKCTKCGEVKPTDEFYRMRNSANQRRNECKQCCDASRALRVVETPTVAQKLCKKCGMVRAADCFFRCRRDVTGLQAYCRDCKKAAARAARRKQPKVVDHHAQARCPFCCRVTAALYQQLLAVLRRQGQPHIFLL